MKWHTYQIAIQFWSRGIDDNDLLELDHVGFLLLSNDVEVVLFDLDKQILQVTWG